MKKKAGVGTYELTLLVGDKTYTTKETDIIKALKDLRPPKLGGKMWLVVKKGNVEKQFATNHLRWDRMFFKEDFLKIFEKKVKMLIP